MLRSLAYLHELLDRCGPWSNLRQLGNAVAASNARKNRIFANACSTPSGVGGGGAGGCGLVGGGPTHPPSVQTSTCFAYRSRSATSCKTLPASTIGGVLWWAWCIASYAR